MQAKSMSKRRRREREREKELIFRVPRMCTVNTFLTSDMDQSIAEVSMQEYYKKKFQRIFLYFDRFLSFFLSFYPRLAKSLINIVTSIHIGRLFISRCVEYLRLLLSLALSIRRG